MIKNTKEDKLSYAAKVKTSCKCYRGAKIKEIQQHLQKDCEINKATKKLQSIVIHAGPTISRLMTWIPQQMRWKILSSVQSPKQKMLLCQVS